MEGAFCYLLSKDPVLLFPGAWLTWCPSLANICPELKILFVGEEPGVLANNSAHLFTPTYVLPITGHGVQAALGFNSDLFGACLFKHRRVRDINLTFPLSGAYHITMPIQFFVVTLPAYMLHMDWPPSSMPLTQCTWLHFLLAYHPCNLCRGKTCIVFTLENRCTSCYTTYTIYLPCQKDLWVNIKQYSEFPKTSGLESLHQM